MKEIKSILVNGGINSLINGAIRIQQRKLGSNSEDIIINSIELNANQAQMGLFNINIHVPNLKNQTSANPTAQDNTQPDI